MGSRQNVRFFDAFVAVCFRIAVPFARILSH